MPLNYHPGHGTVVYCDFDKGGFMPPEMVKSRPVVVLSTGKGRLATVVPLSGTEPIPFEDHHYEMSAGALPPRIDRMPGRWWAKCDCVTTVGLFRLNLVESKNRNAQGRKVYETNPLPAADLSEIKKRVSKFLNL